MPAPDGLFPEPRPPHPDEQVAHEEIGRYYDERVAAAEQALAEARAVLAQRPGERLREAAEQAVAGVDQVRTRMEVDRILIGTDPGLPPADRYAAAFDALDARLSALPDEQLRAPGDRAQLVERLRRIPLNPAQRAQADREQRLAAYAELSRISAGQAPSGRFTREQLQQAAVAARAEAAQLARDAALRAGGRAEHVPQGATAEVPHWRARPYGSMPTAELPGAIAAADRETARLLAAAERRDAELERWRAQAAAGEGPAMRELTQRRAQLQGRIAAGVEADTAAAAAEAGYTASRNAWQEIQRLEAERQRNPIALRLAGTSRAAIAAQQEQLRETAQTAAADAARHTTTAQDRQRQAGGPDGGRRAAADLAALDATWQQRTAEARERDARGPAAVRLAYTGDEPRARAAAQQQRAAGLRAEAELRERLDPVQQRAEDTGRARRAEEQDQAARQRAETQRVEADRISHDHSRHGPDADHGPSLGR